MISIAFPKMFTDSRTLLTEDHEATVSNLKLLLLSDKGALFGDPYFGTVLKRFFYEQNNNVLRDLIIDEIYSAIITFMPQLRLTRDKIKVTSNKTSVSITVDALNLIDYTPDMLEIPLTSDIDLM